MHWAYGSQTSYVSKSGALVADLGINISNTNEGMLTGLLLSGSIELNFVDNVKLLKTVQDYITATKRF